MQPDNPTGELDVRHNSQAQPADWDTSVAVSEAINVVCDELFSSHMLGAASDAEY